MIRNEVILKVKSMNLMILGSNFFVNGQLIGVVNMVKAEQVAFKREELLRSRGITA